MSKRVKKNAHILHFLSRCDKHTSSSILKSAKSDLIHCISDICYNILEDKIKLTSNDKRKLAKHKKKIRKIANPATTHKTKRELVQKGGFISLLLKTLAPVIAPLAKGLLGIE